MGWPPRQTSLQMEHRVAQMSWLGAMLCVQQLLVASYTEASWSNNVVNVLAKPSQDFEMRTGRTLR